MMTSNYTRLQFSSCKILDNNSVFGTERYYINAFGRLFLINFFVAIRTLNFQILQQSCKS